VRLLTAWPVGAAAALALLAGCGDGDGTGARRPTLVVSAAASLQEALTTCSRDDPKARVRLSFAGSDELAAQIRQGVKPDVFAAANTKLPQALHQEGRLQRPVVFATNELVLAVPADGARVTSLDDLGGPAVKLVVGSADVPVGAYTRGVLDRLPAGEQQAIRANVRSEEPDVKGVVGKLVQGAADAGFVYATDVEGSSGRLRAIALPAQLRPVVAYGAGMVRGADEPGAAAEYLRGLVRGGCADALRQAGFGPPPR